MGLTKPPFLAINAKGGEMLRLKQKDRTTQLPFFLKWWFMFVLSIGILWWKFLVDIFQIGMLIFNWYIFKSIPSISSNWYLLKPSWKLRGEFHSGGVLFSQRKSIWNRGRKFSNLENTSQNLIYIPLTICKNTLKRICKNKTSGASVVQNVK